MDNSNPTDGKRLEPAANQDDAIHAAEPGQAEEVPDPNGPPRPVSAKGWSSCGTVAALLLGGGLVLPLMIGVCSRPTMGVPSSSRLKWEERTREIDRAAQEDAESSDAATKPCPTDREPRP
jgi:hypothetical protein